MFEKVIKIYNEKNPRRKINKRLLVQCWVMEGFCSYAYGWKLFDAVNSGKQMRVNCKIIKYTAGFCGVTIDKMYEDV